MELYYYKAFVKRVIDGDTIDVNVDLGFQMSAHMRLRLLRINTPELNSKDPEVRLKALEAKMWVTEKIDQCEVIIRTEKADSFGRYLAEVFTSDGMNINDELLKEGLAELYR